MSAVDYSVSLFCRIQYDRPTSSATEECMTCSMPEPCRHTWANFGKNAKYYLLNCYGPGIPVHYLCSSYNASDGEDKSIELVFSARQHAERAICYRKSVCLSVTRLDQSKTVELRVMQF